MVCFSYLINDKRCKYYRWVRWASGWLGDTGALSLGAMLAVIALMLDASLVLPIVGFIFVLESVSSLAQLVAKGLFKKRIFIAAPLHHHFEAKGWDETKVTMRFWLAGAVFAFAGLFI